MTDLNNFFYTDGVDDVMASYVNELVAGNLRGELTNIQSLSANLTLNDASFPIQYLTPLTVDRTVFLPLAAETNHLFFFKNLSASINLIIKDSTGVTTFLTLTPGGCIAIAPAGGVSWVPFSLWYNLPSMNDSTTPAISPADVVTQFSMIGNMLRSITGAENWYTKTPAVTDSTTPTSSPTDVSTLHGMLGAMLRSITGAANWYTKAPVVTDSTTPTSSPTDVSTLHGMLGAMLRSITGAANWYTKAPVVTDSTAPTSSPASVIVLLSMMANILKTITGKSNWYDAAIAPQSIAIGSNASAAVIATGVTTYLAPFGSGAFNVALSGTYWPVPKSGVVRNFRVRTNNAQSAGGTLVITVMKAAAAQTLEITVAASEAGGTKADTSNSFSVVAGDLITFRFVNNGSGNSAQIVGVSCELSHQ